MLLEFLAAIVLGLALAGVVMAINAATGRRLPSWLAPAAAGVGMIVFMISMEYSWLPRTVDSLPEGVEVVSISRESTWYRPWTYVRPLSLRIVALDTRRNRTHADQPGRVMTSVLLLGRWMPARRIPVVFDCTEGRRADLHGGVELDPAGDLPGADWRQLAPDDPALAIACNRQP
ncbi:hypothetical protein [Wenzhouxiangella limi]|uniref:Uncharacterized protein n=1 Tax=Wenzhouxiangella limi TaxID=2707351 RepID=A0A845V458_9GAMM|nr:hypothetical protein [Wenzhouxiangella limi]NDY95976.1 hypothetical protein [Wenzhouxiangella limi]